MITSNTFFPSFNLNENDEVQIYNSPKGFVISYDFFQKKIQEKNEILTKYDNDFFENTFVKNQIIKGKKEIFQINMKNIENLKKLNNQKKFISSIMMLFMIFLSVFYLYIRKP